MSRFLLAAVAAALTVTFTGSAHAHGGMHMSGGPRFTGTHIGSSYKSTMNQSRVFNTGTKFSHGYYFHSNNFYYNSRCWSSRYGCYCYWCPSVSCWYYWCAPQACYYPVSYITIAPPTVIVNTTAATVATPGPAGPGGAMPPAGPPVP